MPASAAAAQKEDASFRFAKDQLKAFVERIEKLEEEKGPFRVERVSDGFREIIQVSSPVLLTIASKTTARLPSLIDIQDSFARNAIECWNLEDLNADPNKVGRSGSGTWVEGLTPTVQKKSCVFIEGDTRQQARTLLSKLLEKNL